MARIPGYKVYPTTTGTTTSQTTVTFLWTFEPNRRTRLRGLFRRFRVFFA